MTTLRRLVMVVLSGVSMLALLFAAFALAFGRYDGAAFYVIVMLLSAALVGYLWRPERALKRAEEARLPPEARPVTRIPRRPITFPLVESLVTFAFWYVVAVIVDRVVTGTTNTFTLAAIAPFAAFLLATITIAGRHMAFRITAEDDDHRGASPPENPPTPL
ncbi:MAG: hypothetical protein HY071_02975 [Chloroflexi bacterium]|nr:hypothetical protein [Chloroflexota bacterium]